MSEATVGEQTEPPILYAYAVVMLMNGEIRVVGDIQVDSVRQAQPSDIIMTSDYIASTLRKRDSNGGST